MPGLNPVCTSVKAYFSLGNTLVYLQPFSHNFSYCISETDWPVGRYRLFCFPVFSTGNMTE